VLGALVWRGTSLTYRYRLIGTKANLGRTVHAPEHVIPHHRGRGVISQSVTAALAVIGRLTSLYFAHVTDTYPFQIATDAYPLRRCVQAQRRADGVLGDLDTHFIYRSP
jgi:hypothetical protein